MATPILFIDRDGTLIEEPPDFQVDALDKLRLVPGVIPALLQLQQAGWELVMVSNQDGLGTPAFPQAAFEAPHRLLMQVLESQGIRFREVLIDPSLPEDHSPARKPGLGLVLHYIQDRSVDWARSAVIGDRHTDVEFAANLGIRAFQLKTPAFGGDWDWPAIAHALVTAPRRAEVVRSTRETRVRVALDLDRAGAPAIATGLAFFDHMLEQVGTHAGIALQVDVDGDLAVDAHHTVEDTGLALGQALREAVGSKRGLARYGFTLPMDEALAQAALDFSGRAYLVFEGSFRRPEIGGLPTEMVEHFFRSLCEGAGINLHLAVRGDNDHHQIEAAFKAFARALGQAVRRDGSALPSTKGAL